MENYNMVKEQEKKLMSLKFMNPLVDILYGILSMARGVYYYGLETAGLMDVSDEIASLLDIPVDTVINPDDKDLEYEIQKLREQIEGDAHDCAVDIAKALEGKIKGKYIESKEEIAECLESLTLEEAETLYKELVEEIGLHTQKDASDFTGIAILEYVSGDDEKKDSLIQAFKK